MWQPFLPVFSSSRALNRLYRAPIQDRREGGYGDGSEGGAEPCAETVPYHGFGARQLPSGFSVGRGTKWFCATRRGHGVTVPSVHDVLPSWSLKALGGFALGPQLAERSCHPLGLCAWRRVEVMSAFVDLNSNIREHSRQPLGRYLSNPRGA